jgi:hypothetical protein
MKVLYIARYSIILFVILCTSITIQSFPDYGALYTTPRYPEESENKGKQNIRIQLSQVLDPSF